MKKRNPLERNARNCFHFNFTKMLRMVVSSHNDLRNSFIMFLREHLNSIATITLIIIRNQFLFLLTRTENQMERNRLHFDINDTRKESVDD